MNYQKKEHKRTSEYSSYGHNQFTNIFTGDTVSPIIIDMDSGKNLNNVGVVKGDTGISNRVLSGKKIELCKSINFPVNKSLVDIEDVHNLDMKKEYVSSKELEEGFIQYLSVEMLHKIIREQK